MKICVFLLSGSAWSLWIEIWMDTTIQMGGRVWFWVGLVD